jgi:hypothetical protein
MDYSRAPPPLTNILSPGFIKMRSDKIADGAAGKSTQRCHQISFIANVETARCLLRVSYILQD